jgi:rRNA maturation RNase YbeY
MATIEFFFPAKNISLRSRNGLKQYLKKIFKQEGRSLGQLSYVFCSDEFLLEMNRNHLQHDYYTDIITFDLSDDSSPVIGEIYISIDRVRDNAAQLKTSINQELHRVIFHGALHLCGYKDKKVKDKQAMRAAEDICLKAYFG